MPTAFETKVHQRLAATGLTMQTLAQQVDLPERVRPLLDTLTALALVRPTPEGAYAG